MAEVGGSSSFDKRSRPGSSLRERGAFIGAVRPSSVRVDPAQIPPLQGLGGGSATTTMASTGSNLISLAPPAGDQLLITPPSTPTSPSPMSLSTSSSPTFGSPMTNGGTISIQPGLMEKKPFSPTDAITLKVRCVANKSFRQMKVDVSATAGMLLEQLAKKFRFTPEELAIFVPGSTPEKAGLWVPRDQKLVSVGLKEGDIVDVKRQPSIIRVAYVEASNVFTSLHVDLSEPLLFSIPSIVASLHTTDFKKEEFVSYLKGPNDSIAINVNKPLQEQNVKPQSVMFLVPITQLAKRPMVSSPTHQGWLTKRSIVDGRTTPTKRRYCILKDNFLWYYKSIQQFTANGVIALEYYLIIGDRSADKLELKLVPSGVCFYNTLQVYFLNASSSTEYDEWHGLLKERCATDCDAYSFLKPEKPTNSAEKSSKLKSLRDATTSTKDLRIMERYSSILGFGKLTGEANQPPKRESIAPAPAPSTPATPSLDQVEALSRLQDKLSAFSQDETPEDRKRRLRGEVISEIIYSEATYQKCIAAAQKYYLEPLSQKAIITKQEIRDLFSNIEEVITASQKLLRYLHGVEELPLDEQALGTVFIQLAAELQVYHQYCVEQDKSMAVREKLYQRAVFNEFLEEAAKSCPESTLSSSLDNILIQPMQRITRYPLLLSQLLKYTPDDHEDFERLKEAIEAIETIVADIEKTRNEAENINKLREIRNKFTAENLPLANAGQFTKEGQVKKIKPGGGTTPATLFLFSNILLIGLPQQNKLVLDHIFELHTCLIESIRDTKYKNVFTVTSTDDSTLARFSCASELEKEQWVSAIKECIEKIAPTGLASGVPSNRVAKLIQFDPDLYPITALVHDLEAQIFRLKEENQELKRRLGLTPTANLADSSSSS